MSIKHTPGPWRAIYVGCSDWDLDGPITEQDWRLAAAAPDLLELSKAFLDALDRDLPHNMKHHAAGERFNLRLAIAKATWG